MSLIRSGMVCVSLAIATFALAGCGVKPGSLKPVDSDKPQVNERTYPAPLIDSPQARYP